MRFIINQTVIINVHELLLPSLDRRTSCHHMSVGSSQTHSRPSRHTLRCWMLPSRLPAGRSASCSTGCPTRPTGYRGHRRPHRLHHRPHRGGHPASYWGGLPAHSTDHWGYRRRRRRFRYHNLRPRPLLLLLRGGSLATVSAALRGPSTGLGLPPRRRCLAASPRQPLRL